MAILNYRLILEPNFFGKIKYDKKRNQGGCKKMVMNKVIMTKLLYLKQYYQLLYLGGNENGWLGSY